MDELDPIFDLLRSSETLRQLEGRERWTASRHPDKIARLAGLAADSTALPSARVDALWLLQRVGPAAKAAVTPLLEDPEPVVRAAAVAALPDVDPEAWSSRAATLFDDPSPWVRIEVLSHAYSLKDRAALLRRGLVDPEVALRTVAARQIAGLPTGGWPASLVAALETVKGNLRAERAMIFALVCCKGDPELAAATAGVAPRLLELAGDEDAYDPDNDIDTGRFAAELLALTGVPTALRPALDAVIEKDGLYSYIREQLKLARSRR